MRLKPLIFFLLFLAIGCQSSFRSSIRVAVDPNWGNADFGLQAPYINGYIQDSLLKFSKYGGIDFVLIERNSDDLLSGLEKGEYDAVLTTLLPHEYYLARYSFSESFLDIGPVLVVQKGSSFDELSDLKNQAVGIIEDDPGALILEKDPSILIRKYSSIPALLNAVVEGQIEGALLDQLKASSFTADLYPGSLHITGKPLNKEAIRLVGVKGKLNRFNREFSSFRKRDTLKELQKKWQLKKD